MYMEYDIAIIGGGPAGYTAAERASENGLKTILFEKNAIGGVCLNEGCIPTITLLYRQDTRQYQKCLQIWYSGDERPKFRLGKDYRPEEQDRP